MINRAALVARPARPFIDWARSLDDSGLVPDPNGEQTVYLIPDFEDDSQARSALKLVYEEVFERELHAWHTDESAWPKDRSLSAFKRWFHIEMHSSIEDLLDHRLEDDHIE
ncbi:MAG: hypothetical protein AAF196_13450 [Planctomycetota bacterium]